MSDKNIRNAIGIDLGTTNTVAAAFIGTNWNPVSYEGGKYLCPSIVSIKTPEGRVGEAAKVMMLKDSHCIKNVKRVIGRKCSEPTMPKLMETCHAKVIADEQDNPVFESPDGQRFNCAMISSKIIKFVCDRASQLSSFPITKAVITVPAHFNENQKRETIQAAKLAEIEVLDIITEPTAAAIGYSQMMKMEDGYYLVYDMGGGTFDVSVVEYKDDIFKIVGSGGNNELGGEDFDRLIADWIQQQYKAKFGKELISCTSENARRRRFHTLMTIAEECKCNLKGQVQVDVDLTEIIGIRSDGEAPTIQLTRSVASDLLEKKVNESLMVVDSTLEKSGIAVKDIKRVLLVGGSSRLFCLNDKLRQKFSGDNVICDELNLDVCVATGAGVYAKKLIEGGKDIIIEKTTCAYGVGFSNNYLDTVIEANTTLPTEATRSYQLSSFNDTYFCTRLYQGNGSTVSECTEIAPIYFDINPVERNGRNIVCIFSVNNGTLFSVKCYYENSDIPIFSNDLSLSCNP